MSTPLNPACGAIHEQCEALLTRLVDLLREDERPRSVNASNSKAGTPEMRGKRPEALRFLQDLDIFVNMPCPDFMYSRGIADTLRVGEEFHWRTL
jgi:hypothetical protein